MEKEEIRKKVEQLKQLAPHSRLNNEKMELLVRLALEENAGLREIADILGININTARKYVLLLGEDKITERQMEYIITELKKLFDFSFMDVVSLQKQLLKLTRKQGQMIILYISKLKTLKNLEYAVLKVLPDLANFRYKFHTDYKEIWKK